MSCDGQADMTRSPDWRQDADKVQQGLVCRQKKASAQQVSADSCTCWQRCMCECAYLLGVGDIWGALLIGFIQSLLVEGLPACWGNRLLPLLVLQLCLQSTRSPDLGSFLYILFLMYIFLFWKDTRIGSFQIVCVPFWRDTSKRDGCIKKGGIHNLPCQACHSHASRLTHGCLLESSHCEWVSAAARYRLCRDKKTQSSLRQASAALPQHKCSWVNMVCCWA